MQSPSEKRLLLNLNEGSSSRRPWSISEIDELSPTTAKNQIPWHGQFAFDLNDIGLVTRIGPPDAYERRKEGLLAGDAGKIRERSQINADLKPCKYNIDQFSMFGTSEPIKYFRIAIFPNVNTPDDFLQICGTPESSVIELEFFISADMFSTIALKIERNSLSGATIFIRNVNGIYSDYEFDTDYGDNNRKFKILSLNAEKQPIEMHDHTDIDPPRMGIIKDFEIHFYTNIISGQQLIKETNDDDQYAA